MLLNSEPLWVNHPKINLVYGPFWWAGPSVQSSWSRLCWINVCSPPPRATEKKTFLAAWLLQTCGPPNPHKSIMSCPPNKKLHVVCFLWRVMFEAYRGSSPWCNQSEKNVTCYTPLSGKGSSFKKRRGSLVYQYILFTIKQSPKSFPNC